MENEIVLSDKQNEFLKLVSEGRNIFLTGKAGTGKSVSTRKAMELLTSNKKKVAAVAPTGIAATNIGGQTIHSLFSINPYGIGSFETANFLKTDKRKTLDNIEIIFIDEISMLRPDILDAMNYTLIKNGCKPLYTKQIIFVGDLKQLPVVLDDNTRSMLYKDYDGCTFLDAKIIEKLNLITIDLDEVHRQSNPEFIESLNIVRDGGKSEYFRQFATKEKPTDDSIILAPYNKIVYEYNQEGLSRLKGEEFVFEAVVSGTCKITDFNLEQTVKVKNGAKIMYLVNSKDDNNLNNGTLGIFVSHNDCHYIRVGNVDYALEKMQFTKKEYIWNKNTDALELKEVGMIEQYPIKLAYAMSIHKSQGLTFDKVAIDLTSPCFMTGQLYVALSRVRTPEGLKIIV